MRFALLLVRRESLGVVIQMKFLRGWRSYDLKPFYFVHCMCLYVVVFSAAFCTAHCALDLARDHAP